MSEVLVLKSINGRILTNKLVDSWLEANEMYVTKKTFSVDQYSVEVTFVDEERAEMMSDLLSTCYGDYILVSRPQTLVSSSMNNSFEEEHEQREPSPVHLSSAMSTSSRVSGFSRRLYQTDKKDDNDMRISSTSGNERYETNMIRNNMSFTNETNTDKDNSTSRAPSVVGSTISSVFGRGRGTIYK